MTNPSDKNEDLAAILRRVDDLPVVDSRSLEEIVGYDDNGVPAEERPRAGASARAQAESVEILDFEVWRKKWFGDEIPHAVKDFLQYRHREWELGMEADLKVGQEKRTERTRKP
ncbi:MAG TPA: hypothetical protein VN911_01965 [Candidatus Acidoferrum sp.]|nr:hypothetical protein [Candidatus Acidoferrum sp.]